MTCRRVLLHHLLELADPHVDFPDRRHLLLRRRGNLLDQVGRGPDHRHGSFQQPSRILGDRHAFLGEVADLLGRGLASLSELAHFAGNDGKPLSVGSGAGGLDGRVERQEIRLIRDIFHHQDFLRDLSHGCNCLVHGFTSPFRLATGLVGGAGRISGVLGIAGDGRIHVLEAAGYFL